MPPKKSGKKKGKKSGKKSAGPTAKPEQLSELTKEYYLIQIRDLENRLERYQKKCDELEVMNGQFKEKHDQLFNDKKEIVAFLKKSLEQRGDEIADLNDRLIGVQQAKDSEKEAYESQLQALRTEFQEVKDQLTSENMILGGKLASLEEFKVQKEDLMAKMANLNDQLKQCEVDHQEEIYRLERKQVVDKDRLKKEMVMRVNQVAAEFRKVSNKQMAETTKRTIRENVSINAQLAKMSDKTMEMIQDSDELSTKEKKQRQQVDMLEANEKELAKKNHSNQKIIRMLTEKCKNQEAMLAEFEMREEQYQEIDSEIDLLRQQVESSRDEIQDLAKENELMEEDLTGTRGDFSTLQKEKHKLEQVLNDAAVSLQNALTEPTEEDVDESPYDVIEKRDNMLENLLVLLNSAAALGIGPRPGHLGKNFDEPYKPKQTKPMSPMPGSGKGIRRGEMPLSPISKSAGTAPTPAHYQLGDLGLIPRPQHHIPSNLEKMAELSTTTRLGSLKKVLTMSVATQTMSSPKAMFFADQLLSKMPNSQVLADIQTSHDRATIMQIGGTKKVPSKVF